MFSLTNASISESRSVKVPWDNGACLPFEIWLSLAAAFNCCCVDSSMPWCTFLDEVEIGAVCSVEVLGSGPHEFVSSNDWQKEKFSKNVGAAGAEYDTSFSAIIKKF